MIGNAQLAYVTFDNYGDYWWISSMIPCPNAEKLNIALARNIKNTTTSNKTEIAIEHFIIRKYKNYFVVLTNNQDVAGYIFGTVHPGIVWEIVYNVQ